MGGGVNLASGNVYGRVQSPRHSPGCRVLEKVLICLMLKEKIKKKITKPVFDKPAQPRE